MMSMNYDVNTGSEKLRPEDLLFRERPSTPQDAFKRARSWQSENWFIRMVNSGNADFFNYGLRILPEDNNKKSRKELVEHFRKNPGVQREILRFIRTVWREWVLNQNVVSFWREKKRTCPFLLLGEQCKYTDAMGIPILFWRPDYTWQDMPKDNDVFVFSGLTAVQAKNRYYLGKEILVGEKEEYDENYEVLTTGYKGRGFSIPDIYSVFRVLSQTESMEVGESMLALLSRRVTLQHKLGFELKGQNGGPNAAFQKDLSIWKKKRADAIIQYFNGRFGFVETTSNFDHDIKLHYVDPKLFDEKRWGTTIARMMWYGGPLAFMMMAKQPNPFLLNIYKTTAESQRGEVGPHLQYVLNQGCKLPMRIQLKWSNRCFYDPRLAWDMVSGLMKQGPLSLTTSLKQGDFDPDEELENKKTEAGDEKYMLPLLSQHGQQGGKTNGRPVQKSAGSVKTTGAKQGR